MKRERSSKSYTFQFLGLAKDGEKCAFGRQTRKVRAITEMTKGVARRELTFEEELSDESWARSSTSFAKPRG